MHFINSNHINFMSSHSIINLLHGSFFFYSSTQSYLIGSRIIVLIGAASSVLILLLSICVTISKQKDFCKKQHQPDGSENEEKISVVDDSSGNLHQITLLSMAWLLNAHVSVSQG